MASVLDSNRLPAAHAADALPRAVAFVDVREGGAVRHAREAADRALALRDDCLAFFPRGMRPLLPALDAVARRWLRRSASPYVAEIEAIAGLVGLSGVWFLNGSYQWGCTALAREEEGTPWLARTLDWAFPGLGRHIDIARMGGRAGDFFSVTWPGYVGTLTAMAPGRFAAALNQAPLKRRTRQPWLRPLDMAVNAVATFARVRHMPPDHLLRQACATCRTFDEARQQLETVPVARPVIFTLVGCAAGERCLIERTEEAHATHREATCIANDWLHAAESWEARLAPSLFLRATAAEAAENSRVRREALHAWNGRFATESFGWVTPPVLNPCTRLAVEMCPSKGILRTVGYEPAPGSDLPLPATQVGEIGSSVARNDASVTSPAAVTS
jgi:hypothetical protein